MSKFRKKPVVIDAVQWTGQNVDEIVHHCGGACSFNHGSPTFFTLEGELQSAVGDWIIRGIKDEIYPCKPDIFEATYRSVDETETPFDEAYWAKQPKEYIIQQLKIVTGYCAELNEELHDKARA